MDDTKKLFTVDHVMVAFVAALGYGFGATLAKLSGWSPLACGAASLVLGIALEALISKVIFSPAIQKSQKKRVLAYSGCVILFLIGHAISVKWMNTSMFEYLGEQFVYVVGLPLFGFVINMIIREFRIKKSDKTASSTAAPDSSAISHTSPAPDNSPASDGSGTGAEKR